jgi:hypothetical protein
MKAVSEMFAMVKADAAIRAHGIKGLKEKPDIPGDAQLF